MLDHILEEHLLLIVIKILLTSMLVYHSLPSPSGELVNWHTTRCDHVLYLCCGLKK